MKYSFYKKKNYSLLVVFSILILNSCNTNNNSNNSFEKVKIIQEWFPSACYAGDIMASFETDSINNLDIEITPGSEDIDPIKIVVSGKYDVGIASADRIIMANTKGANLCIIGAINFKSPACFIAKRDKNILSPKDFEGKKVGILTGTNNEIIYNLMIDKLNIDRSKIEEIEISFDMNSFLMDIYDVRPAFIYDEPVTLDMKNIDYSIIKPEDYDINFIGTAYFVRRKLIDDRPEYVQRIVNSLAKGWELALSNPKKSINYLKIYDKNINIERETQSLIKGSDYFKGENNKILFASKKSWNKMAKYLIDLNFIDEFNYNKIINNNFINNYHTKKNND